MPIPADICYGCDSRDAPIEGDHVHQYINFFGNAITCWWIDGKCFTEMREATYYVETTLRCSQHESVQYVMALPKKYN